MKSYEIQSSLPVTETNEELHPDIDIEKDSDDVIAKKIDLRIDEAKHLHNEVSKGAEEGLNLFRGNLEKISNTKVNKYKSKTVLSRIFFTVRNLVGMATDNPPFVEMIPDSDNPKDIERAKDIQTNIDWQMLEIDFNGQLAMALFDAWIKRDAFFMWYWDYDRDDVSAVAVPLEDLTISPDATTIQDAEYVIYHPWKNRGWWKENYSKEYEKIKFVQKTSSEIGDGGVTSSRGNSARLIQYWQNDILVEKVKGKDGADIILKKVKNPYFEYRTPEEQQAQYMAKFQEKKTFAQKAIQKVKSVVGLVGVQEDLSQIEFVPIRNYLTKARKPFVQIPSIKLLGEFYSEEISKQVKEVFLSMNDKKRAFADNLRGCNQKMVVDSNSLSEEEADRITDEPNQVIRADFSENAKPFYIEKGGEVPASFHNDIMHDEAYIDDVYGNHEISRGAGNSGTLGQDKMNFQSDRTPIRFQSRATERAIVEIVEGWLQLMRLFYTEEHYARKWGERDGIRVVKLINEDIKEGVKPHIKPGSMISLSKEARASRAVQLFGMGALDPYTMFVELDMPNPSELSDRLVNWIKFQMISSDDPETIQADMNGSDPILQSVERADQENRAFQMGDNVPPTPPEYVTEDHVKSHYAFLGDKKMKMDDADADLLRAHAEVDKSTLVKVGVGMLQSKQGQGGQPQQQQTPQGKPTKATPQQ